MCHSGKLTFFVLNQWKYKYILKNVSWHYDTHRADSICCWIITNKSDLKLRHPLELGTDIKIKALFQIFQNFVGNPGFLLAEITEVLDLTSNIRGTDTGKCEAIFLCTQIKDLTCGLVGEHEFLSFARCHTGIHPNEIIHFIRVTRKIMAALWVKVSFLPSIAAIMVSIDLWSKSFFESRVNWYASSSRSICPWARSRTFCVFSADLPITSANRYSCWAIVKPVPLTWPYKVFLKFVHGW